MSSQECFSFDNCNTVQQSATQQWTGEMDELAANDYEAQRIKLDMKSQGLREKSPQHCWINHSSLHTLPDLPAISSTNEAYLTF